jgi:Tol biopolymer transport system component
MRIFPVQLLLGALASSIASAPALVAQDTTKVVVVDTTTKYKSDSLPLKPERTFRFDTDEGTWISLDVSPDGKTLVFELLGDLYTMPITGGETRRITSGLPFDTQPRYSPDGKRIVFLSERDGAENVWTCDPDGSKPQQVTRSKTSLYASPVWTPDGDYVVVSRQEDALASLYQLWMYHKDGGTGISLTKSDSGQNSVGRVGGRPGIDALGAAFGSDPRYIWYARHRGGFGYNLTFPLWQLATYDRETSKIVVQSDIYGSSMRPVLSRDGKWLVYASRHDGETGLRLRDLSNGSERWLRYPVQRDDQESRYTRDLMPGSSFTPDSRALITSYAGRIWRVDVPGGRATAIPFRVRVEQEAGPLVKFSYPVDTGDVLVRQVRNPVSSPDGKRIAFSALDRLYVMDWPKGTPRRLTRDSAHEQVPAWSPDGQWIAFVSWGDSGGTVMRVRSDGGKPERLVTARGFFDLPAWSPDGRRIVVVRQPLDLRVREKDPTGYDLAWLPANGGQLTRIAFVSPGGRPHFGQDTSRIYITDPNDGLVSMRWDGTDRRMHLKVTGYKPPTEGADPETASEIRVSPDGKRAAAQAGNRVYLVSLPRIGAQVPEVSITMPKDEVAFPAKRLTRVGGDFVNWSSDGKYIEWSIGRSYFRYDPVVGDSLDRLKTSADSARADSLEKMEAAGKADTAAKARADSIAKLPGYEGERLDITIKAPRDVPRGTVVLRGARIISMKGDEVIEKGDVVVKDNRITYVGASRSGQDAGATVIDVAGKTIILGVIDLSTPEVETGEVVAGRVKRALQFVEPERVVIATDCGMKYLPRDAADGKMRAMAEAATTLRSELGSLSN